MPFKGKVGPALSLLERMWTMWTCAGVFGAQKGAMDDLELELQAVASHHVVAGNGTCVLWTQVVLLITESFL